MQVTSSISIQAPSQKVQEKIFMLHEVDAQHLWTLHHGIP
jgi:hypothetical protein